MSRLEFAVTGMVCRGCSSSVERVAAGVAGVTAARVDHAVGSAVVEHDGNADAEALYAAIVDAGFGVRTCGNAACECSTCRCEPCACGTGVGCGCD